MKKVNKISKYMYLAAFMLLMGGIYTGYCQQDSQYTLYMYNMESINPAYVGNRGMLSFMGLYRNQWVGLEGAPETMTFSLNSPVGERGVGLGLSFYSDQIGPSDFSNISSDFSYTISLSDNTQLAMGIKGGINLLNIDYTKLNQQDPTDPDFANNIDKQISPIAGAGFYLFGDRWYLGLSSPNVLRTKYYDDVAVSEATSKAHYFLTGGYVFNLSSEVKFKPAFMARAVAGAPLGLDISANFLFLEKFMLGGAYRLDASVSGLAGFQITDAIMAGYAFDYDTTDLGNYNSGTHEFLLRFELGTRRRRSVNPRFF